MEIVPLDKLSLLIDTFHELFLEAMNTQLSGGHAEPVYLPAQAKTPAQICFRDDFVSSALHEIAHWCVAGKERRAFEDYGYWYAPDGRTQEQQRAFVMVEARPQAVEWYLSLALDVPFRVSADNLENPEDTRALKRAVHSAFVVLTDGNCPPRATVLARALAKKTDVSLKGRIEEMSEGYLDQFWESNK